MNASDRRAVLISLSILFAVAMFWIGVAYVVWHFISKFW